MAEIVARSDERENLRGFILADMPRLGKTLESLAILVIIIRKTKAQITAGHFNRVYKPHMIKALSGFISD